VRTLDRLDVTRNGELIEIRATAQSFLHNQIRSFAGTLKLAGEGKWTPDDVEAALQARDRKACGPVAPPDGLYFMQVDYPDVIPDRRRPVTDTDANDGDADDPS
jgi:tRNA pseudouridine38-40 synthase